MDIGNGFGGEDRQRYLRIALVAGVILVVLLLVLIVVAIVRGRSASSGSATPTVVRTVARSPIVASPVATVRATVPVSLPSASSVPSASASTAAPPSAVPSASAGGRSFVVANTGGEGVKLRSEPATTAQEVAVLPDGQRLKEIGPSRNAGGRDWYNVQDEAGNKGWVAAEFTAPAP